MSTNFSRSISNTNGVLGKRASIMEEQARISQESIINSLKKRKSDLDLKIEQHMDLSPDESTSLKPNCKNWDSDKWTRDLQSFKLDLWAIERQLEIAKKTLNDLFKED